MAKFTVKLLKAAKGLKPAAAKKATGPVVDFAIQDNQDSTCTVMGVDASGFPVDISALATLTPAPTSSDTTKVVVDPPTGMTFLMHAIAPTVAGSPVTVAVTATWNDGSIGPFGFNLPVDVVNSPTGGIVVQPGTPVTRP